MQQLGGHQQNVRIPLTEQTVYGMSIHLNTASKNVRKGPICILSPCIAVTNRDLAQKSSASPDGRCYTEYDILLGGNSEQEWHTSMLCSVMNSELGAVGG